MNVDAKELDNEMAACEYLRDYWQEKEAQAKANVARFKAQIERLTAELSQVSA